MELRYSKNKKNQGKSLFFIKQSRAVITPQFQAHIQLTVNTDTHTRSQPEAVQEQHGHTEITQCPSAAAPLQLAPNNRVNLAV